MSALGQKRTFAMQKAVSALPLKADMCAALAYVRFGPKADIRYRRPSITCRRARRAGPLPPPDHIGNSLLWRYEHDLILSDEEFECFDLRDLVDHQQRKPM
jgi:hypothetical protein